jgi:hypothetical protein
VQRSGVLASARELRFASRCESREVGVGRLPGPGRVGSDGLPGRVGHAFEQGGLDELGRGGEPGHLLGQLLELFARRGACTETDLEFCYRQSRVDGRDTHVCGQSTSQRLGRELPAFFDMAVVGLDAREQRGEAGLEVRVPELAGQFEAFPRVVLSSGERAQPHVQLAGAEERQRQRRERARGPRGRCRTLVTLPRAGRRRDRRRRAPPG